MCDGIPMVCDGENKKRCLSSEKKRRIHLLMPDNHPHSSNRTRARVLNRIQDGHLFNPLCSGFVGSSRASLVSVDSNA